MRFPEPIPHGVGTLSMRFRGTLTDQMAGFYRSGRVNKVKCPICAAQPEMFSFGQQGAQQGAQPSGLFGQQQQSGGPSPGGLFSAAPSPGATGLFGQAQQPATGGLFGQAQQPATGGLFGQAQQPATGGMFGQAQQPATGGLFGQTQQPVAASPFGQAQQPTSGGLFGQTPQPVAASPFGQPQQSGGLFGQAQQPTAASPFGQAQQPTTGGLFGQIQQPASGGLFGQAQQAPSPFGQTQPSAAPSPFGQTQQSAAPSPFASPFGSTTAAGTSGPKYQTTRDPELGGMKVVAITAMDAYSSKCLEELRWEDYQRASGQQAATPFGQQAGSAFGASPQPSGLFGGQQQSSGLFGSTQPAQQTGGLFGSTQPAQQTGGLFGSTQPAQSTGGLFGSAQPAQQTGGLFGSTQPAQQTGGLFGSTQPAQQTGGLFGAAQPTQQTGGLFGSTQPAQSTGGLFGSTQPAQQTGGGLFGAAQPTQQTGGLFGSTQPAQQTSGLFGSTQPAQSTGGLFGSAQPVQQGGLFGSAQPAQSTGGLFGSTQPAQQSGGLFGSTQPTQSTGGLFGSTQSTQQTGGLFGSPQPAQSSGGLFGATQPAQSTGGLFGSSPAQSTGGLFGSTQPAQSTGGLFGSSPAQSTGGLFGSTQPSGGLFGGSTPAQAGGSLFGSAQPASTGGLFGSAPSTGSLFGSTQPASSTTSGLFSSAPTGSGLGFAQGNLFGSSPVAVPPPVSHPNAAPRPTGIVLNKALDKDSLSAFLWKDSKSSPKKPTVLKVAAEQSALPEPPRSFVPTPSAALPDVVSSPPKEKVEDNQPPLRLPVTPIRPNIIYTTPTKSRLASASVVSKSSLVPNSANHNIWTKPSFEAMAGMTEAELTRIEHFQIGHYGIGSVTWPGLTDVRFLNIDDMIIFKKGSVTLFPDEDLKPPVGSGLNKTAIIELTVKPKNFELAKKHQDRYESEMKKLTETNGAEFLSYDLETWRFRVDHFSTWGIDAMQWEEIDVTTHVEKVSKRKNDLSLFSRIEQEYFIEENDDEMEDDSTGRFSVDSEEITIGALAVAPPTRSELIAMGWNLKVCDLFLNQSFRVSFDQHGTCCFPAHPVIFNQHQVVLGKLSTRAGDMQALLELVAACSQGNLLQRIIDSEQVSAQTRSIFVLLQSLIQKDQIEAINSEAFNNWLSHINAETIKSNSATAYSPAAALATRDYTPSASSQLLNAGHPRLALAVAAATANETARLMMKDQFAHIDAEQDVDIQQVCDILGGRYETFSDLDWRAQLALRYWFCEGNLMSFDPPADSIEWKLIRSVVLNEPMHDADEMLSFAISLIAGQPSYYITKRLADHILLCGELDWQWAVLVQSFLPPSVQRTKLIADTVGRNIEKDCSKIEEWNLVSREELVAAKAVAYVYAGNVDEGRELLIRNGMNKQAKTLLACIPR